MIKISDSENDSQFLGLIGLIIQMTIPTSHLCLESIDSHIDHVEAFAHHDRRRSVDVL